VFNYSAEILRTIPSPGEVREAVWRHTLVGRAAEMIREDVEVETWAGRYEFRGRVVPPGLLRFQKLRKVSVRRKRVRGFQGAWSQQQEALLDLLLLKSPLTDLMHCGRSRPRFHVGACAKWLADRELSRALCFAWVGGERAATSLNALSAGLVVRAQGGADPGELKLLLAAAYHCHLLLLGERPMPGRGEEPRIDLGSHRLDAGESSLYIELIKCIRTNLEALQFPPDESLGEPMARSLRAFDSACRSLEQPGSREAAALAVSRALETSAWLPVKAEILKSQSEVS